MSHKNQIKATARRLMVIISLFFVLLGVIAPGGAVHADPPNLAGSLGGSEASVLADLMIQSQATSTASVLLLDTSGSMDDEDITGVTKIEAARRASNAILDVILTENRAISNYQHQVGLVSFDDFSTTHSELTGNLSSIQPMINNLDASGSTAMADGLRESIDLVNSANQSYSKMIILLSDGLPNVGLNGVRGMDEDDVIQEVLDLARRARASNICINTVGLGLPRGSGSSDVSMNEDLLRQISAASGCGQYYDAQNATDLVNAFIEIRHASLGEILLSQSGTIADNQELVVGNVPVDQNQEVLLFTLNWPSSTLKLIVNDPSGVTVDESYPNASLSATDFVESLVITDPTAGNWVVSVLGLDVPEGTTDYNMLVSARQRTVPLITDTPTPQPTPAPESNDLQSVIIIVSLLALVILVFGGLAIGATLAGSGKSQQTGARAVLSGASYYTQGQQIPLSKNFVIGRGAGLNLSLQDQRISRSHAQIVYSNGTWMIRDLNSQLGTAVNGRYIATARLTPGDIIQIGDYAWAFLLM